MFILYECCVTALCKSTRAIGLSLFTWQTTSGRMITHIQTRLSTNVKGSIEAKIGLLSVQQVSGTELWLHSQPHELLFDLSDNKAYSLAFHSARLFSIGCGWVGSRASGTRRALTPNLQSRRPLEVEATHKTVRPCQAVTVQRKLAL